MINSGNKNGFGNDAHTKLLLHCDGANNSTNFLDSAAGNSGKVFTATAATTSTAAAKFGSSSMLGTGAPSYLTTPVTSDFNLGTTYTVDFWYNTTDTTEQYFCNIFTSAGASKFMCEIYLGTNFSWRDEEVGTGWNTKNIGASIADGAWHHLEFARSGGTWYFFIDGTLQTSYGSGAGAARATGQTKGLVVGAYLTAGSYIHSLVGYNDEFRVSNIVRHTSSFTPATTPYVTDDATVCLLHMEGANAGTTFTDSSQKTKIITAVRNTVISTTQSKFGGSSVFFSGLGGNGGAGDYLSIPNSTDFDLVGDFTIDFWMYPITSGGAGANMCMMGTALYAGSGTSGFTLVFAASPYPTTLLFGWAGGTPNAMNSNTSFNQNTWYHIAYVRSGTTLSLYVNGVFDKSTTLSASLATSNPLLIGRSSSWSGGHWFISGGVQDFGGYMDEIRISNFARWTKNFTVPNRAY